MVASSTSLLITRAQKGDMSALTQLLNRALSPKQITVHVSRNTNRLTIFADGQEVPCKHSLVGIIKRGVQDLDLSGVEYIKVYGRKVGEATVIWEDEIILKTYSSEVNSNSNISTLKIQGQIRKLLDIAKTYFFDLKKTIYNIHISRKLAISIACFIGVAILACGSVIGISILQMRSSQYRTIQKAQVILTNSDLRNATDVITIKDNIDKLKQARDLLRGISNSPGSLYSEQGKRIKH